MASGYELISRMLDKTLGPTSSLPVLLVTLVTLVKYLAFSWSFWSAIPSV